MRAQHRRRPPRQGSAIIEMALVTPLFVMLLLGQLEMIRLGMVTQLLTSAAREGARVAVIPRSNQSTVNGRINDSLASSGIDMTKGTISITPSNWQSIKLDDPDNKITVKLSISYGAVSWLPTPQYLGNPTLQASATLSSERVQPDPYP